MHALNRVSADDDRFIVALGGRPDAIVQLIAFPFAGCGANFYRPWRDGLADGDGPDIALHAIRLPGRETRMAEAGTDCMATLVDDIVLELTSDFWGKKLAFFGHSMGAIIAYEVSRRIGQLYRWEPEVLFISGHKAPQDDYADDFHRQPDGALIEEVKRLEGGSPQLLADPEFLTTFLPVLRQDYALIEKYRYQPGFQLNCPLALCTGEQDTEVSPEEILRWQHVTGGTVRRRLFDGKHFYLNHHSTELVRFIKDCIDDRVRR